MAFADLDIDLALPAYYAGTGGGGGEADDSGATVVFRYTPRGGTDGGSSDGEQTDPVTSHASDPLVGWTDPDGVQAVAQAILRHYTGNEPDQAALEALTMDQGDDWVANPSWTLTVDELARII